MNLTGLLIFRRIFLIQVLTTLSPVLPRYGTRNQILGSVFPNLELNIFPVSPNQLQDLMTHYLQVGFVFHNSVKLVKVWLKPVLRKYAEI